MFALSLPGHAQLRPLEPYHAEEFAAHLDRARAHIAPWVGESFVASGLDGARRVLQRYADDQAADRRRLFGIWLDGVLVGGTMFVSFDAASGVCELGCWLEPAAEGRGLITPVTRMMIDWAFRVRGLSRAEWRTLPGNTRSVAVAKRLGMSLDGTLRQVLPGREGPRRDVQIWSVLASEWRHDDGRSGDKEELDRLAAAFLGAFDNTGGRRPDLESLRQVFIPEARIIKNLGAQPVVQDLGAFIEPRQRMLTDGTLTDFSEWEVAERTEIHGTVAHRFSHYRKAGRLDGDAFEGAGHKTTQFVRTPDGWRISSMAWDDEV
ncbi:GNAT family N-acetyltransferase [Nonomuraea soli]|uniref:RimJ/RimL family protein N-acetyltransferase n=1 Tax=Nonomuraea soli TaxID=1032476 RepID=A0A7W0CDZ8_9ACTN|nr:GNAT family N-acetyltransferase [Nonomuraea soli]MBA2889422.1 RimJ/RimL family protein N-acetyltransferase [Nonomuraea soli]